jgi:tetratricopeptide (TPR) repeat protein
LYEQAIKLDPTNSKAFNNLAVLLEYKLNNVDKARIFYERAIDADPKYGNAYYNLAILYASRLNQIEKAK